MMDLLMGGDLAFQMHLQPKHHFCLEVARFYAGQILSGVSHMHSKVIQRIRFFFFDGGGGEKGGGGE